MATVHGKNFFFSQTSSTLSTYSDNLSISMDYDTAEVTAAGDACKAFLSGDYGVTWSVGGAFDNTNTTGQDYLVFASFDGNSDTWIFRPTSETIGVTNAAYNQSVIATNYTITAGVADAVRWSMTGQGTGAITRTTA